MPWRKKRKKHGFPLGDKEWEVRSMLSELKSDSRVVGAKQVLRAIEGGRARQVFIARDADPRITEQVERLCREREIAVEATASMRELGAACSIAVGAAVAALVR